MLGLQILGGILMAGSKPKVPDMPQINATEEAKKSIQGNQANFDDAAKLTGDTNEFNQSELLKQLRAAIPGYDEMMAKGGGVINSMLSGELPKDVMQAIQRSTAGKAFMGGFGGSQAAAGLTARDIGLTSLDLTGKGIESAMRWVTSAKATAVAPMLDVASMFISPMQQIAVDTTNRDNTWNRDWLGAQIAAQPDAQTKAIGAAIIKTDDQIMSMASSLVGGMACWVAREVYGVNNPKWVLFREWMLREAPAGFRWLYLRFGERFALWIHDKPAIKDMVRGWMDARIAGRAI